MSERKFSSTRTSARKFFAKDQVRNPTQTGRDTNSTHVSTQANGLSSVASAVAKMAENARVQVAGVRKALLDVPAEPRRDEQEPELRSGASDLKSFNSVTIADVQTLIDTDTERGLLASEAVRDLVSKTAASVFSSRGRSDDDDTSEIIPQIEEVSVDVDRKKGSVDCFFSVLKFNLPTSKVEDGTIVAVRVFRALSSRPALGDDPGRLSVVGVDRIRSDKNRSRQKNQDPVSPVENRLRESGVDNALSALIPIDQFVNSRTGASVNDTEIDIVRTVSNNSLDLSSKEADLAPFLIPTSLMHLDRSVVNDLRSLRNIQVQNPGLSAVVERSALVVPERDQTGSGGLVVDPNNKLEFVELAFMSPDKLSAKKFGSTTQYTIEDQTISYGRIYDYFVVAVDRSLNESARSKIVRVSVDGLRIPERPRRVTAQVIDGFVSMTVQVDDQLVEKFEIYRRSDDPSEIQTSVDVRTVLPETGFISDLVQKDRLSNMFLPIGEALNAAPAGGGSFRDMRVLPGRTYTYRVYSVDIFGNKSESPHEVEVFVPDPAYKLVNLKSPLVTAEVDAKTNRVKVSFSIDDDRVVALLLSRRDLTIGQKSFTTPDAVNHIKMGLTNRAQGGKNFEDVRNHDTSRDIAWGGYFQNTGELFEFVDNLVTFDHTYQYQVIGVDRFGNRTSPAISRPVFVSRRPYVDSPLNLGFRLQTGEQGEVQGVALSWDDGNVDITAEDRLGDREVLSNNGVRTLFQVERRRTGEDRWLEFPLVEGTSMFDATEEFGGSVPGFRPPFVRLNETYEYRVQAFQTGTFISNFSRPVSVFVGSPVAEPIGFQIRTADTRTRPFYVMLNWDTRPGSGIVDRWEIERVVVNNVAASRLNTRDETQLEKLGYEPFRVVFRESSRFRSSAQDVSVSVRDVSTVVAPHHFMDTAVEFGNTYFYRMRAVGTDGTFSRWVYRGVKISSSTSDDRLLSGDKSKLSDTLAPVTSGTPAPSKTFGMTGGFASSTTSLVRSVSNTSVSDVSKSTSAFSSVLASRTRKFR